MLSGLFETVVTRADIGSNSALTAGCYLQPTVRDRGGWNKRGGKEVVN